MTRIGRTAAFTTGALALLLSMTGCLGGSPAATSAPDVVPSSPGSSPTPTADPADPLTTVTALVARPEALELRAEGGTVVTSLDYMSSPADAVTALSTVFGAPPADEPYAGTNHAPAGVLHRWDTFVLEERLYDEDRRQAEGYDWVVWPRFAVYFDGPAAGSLILSTASGLQAGDAWSDAEADPGYDADLWTCTATSVEAVTTAVPSTWTGPDRVNVIVMPSDDGATVKWIGAPELEADGCA
ncbi:hypothetical protein [Agromyces bauzanensis]